jgi:hypothetical protein
MKKIAVNTVKAFLKENKKEDAYTQAFTVGDSSFEVSFHTALTIAEKSTFLNRVVSGCFDATGKFRPEYVSPMLRATILQMCTNIPAMTLKNETDEVGVLALDVDAMNELYLAMDLDHVQNAGYQDMLNEMVPLCGQAIDWKKSSILADHGTDTALRDLLEGLADKVKDIDTESLMQYAGILSEGTKGLGEGGILQGLLNSRKA